TRHAYELHSSQFSHRKARVYVIQIKLRTSFFVVACDSDCGCVCWQVGSGGGQNRPRIFSLSPIRTLPTSVDMVVRRSRLIKRASSGSTMSSRAVAKDATQKSRKRHTGNTIEEWEVRL